MSYEFLADYTSEVTSEQIRVYDAIISLAPHYTARTFTQADGRLSLVARFGVGYDNVDLDTLTVNDVMLTTTPDGVRRPVASAIVTLILSLAHQVNAKECFLRRGGWHRQCDIVGTGLHGRTLGSIGVGNIGAELFRLIRPFGMRFLAYDPYANPSSVSELDVELADLPTLLGESDFLCINCPLTSETRGLVGTREIAMMKPTSFLINTARGPIVDQSALYAALKNHRIRGAALDVFEQEPLSIEDPLLELDNIMLTPHALAITDEMTRGNGESAIRAVLSVAAGEIPPYVVNSAVLSRPAMQRKLYFYRRP